MTPRARALLLFHQVLFLSFADFTEAFEIGDGLPVSWRHRSERYGEKLATPDTSVGDLVGDAVRPEHITFDAEDAAVRLFGAVAGDALGVEVAGDFHTGRVAQLRATAMHSIS